MKTYAFTLISCLLSTSALAGVLDPNASIDVDYQSTSKNAVKEFGTEVSFGWFQAGTPETDNSGVIGPENDYFDDQGRWTGEHWEGKWLNADSVLAASSFTSSLHFDRITNGGQSIQVTLSVADDQLKYYTPSGRPGLQAKLKLQLAACDGDPVSVTPVDPLAPLADVIDGFRAFEESDYMQCVFKIQSLNIGEQGNGILNLTQPDKTLFQVLNNGDINVTWAVGQTLTDQLVLYKRQAAIDPNADDTVSQNVDALTVIFKNYGNQILLLSDRSAAEQAAAATAFVDSHKDAILSTLKNIDSALAQASIGARIGAMIQIQRGFGFVQYLEAKITKGNALNEVITSASTGH